MTIEYDLRDRIIASVKEGFAEQIEFTKALVRFPSIRGEEHAIQDFVIRSFRDEGLALDRFSMDRAAIEQHPGGSKFSAPHQDAPIVGATHRPGGEADDDWRI